MRQYERYLFMNLLWPTVLITASLTSIVWLTEMLRFLDFIMSRGLSIGDFMYLTGLMLPSLLLMLMPISLCVAVIYTYNKLTVESELIVLNAVGVSKWQMTKPVMLIGLICTIICYALSLYLMPIANKHFRDMRSFFRDKYASVLLEEQVFNNPIDGVTVFVRERDAQNNLHGILLHDNRDPKQTVTMIADHGRMQQTPSGPRFYLENGVRQMFKDGKVSWLAFDDYAIDIAFYGKDSPRKQDADERTITQLFDRDGLTPKEQAAYHAEAHHRIAWPSFAFALPLFALATLFSSEFNRRGQWRRMIIAAAGMLVIVLIYFAMRNLTLKYNAVVIAMYGMVVGPALVSAYLLKSGKILTFRRRSTLLPQEGVATA
jgi:lipopolysaccharide export system permease protein